LKVLIEFARGWELRLVLEARERRPAASGHVGEYPAAIPMPDEYAAFDSQSGRWTDWQSYQRDVLHEFQTNEVASGPGANFGNTYAIAVRDLKPGDMITYMSDAPWYASRHGRRGHVQLVVESTLRASGFSGPPESGNAHIFQGNLGRSGRRYVPDPVQEGRYFWRANSLRYQRDQNPETEWAPEWRRLDGLCISWNFAQFNKGVSEPPDRGLR
jgi:hypothetical protein